ncbi:hypothetical protein [Marinicella meishanensis]|uniref:hypothetical protein n=1 Tax=Marinicella meishanensis TaxID=2873263 RepID=UPI001CC0DB46|nr:hypothetical protein [Marinicella sp. NBU2979]
MAYGDIPQAVKEKLASERIRMYHAIWHLVRNESSWNSLPTESREQLIADGWEPPRFETQEGAGIDFLFMHQRMIEMTNSWANEGRHHYHHHIKEDVVIPWVNIPWDHNDPVWPMPEIDLASNPDLQNIFRNSKDQNVTNYYKNRVENEFSNREWLRNITLDALGTELERSIHGWMHMHWSSEPPDNTNTLDVDNDWLGSPFSSHVNSHFWKLHGWIDNRIVAWGDANGVEPALSGGWDGPLDSVTGEMHSADPKLFKALKFDELPRIMMLWDDLLLEDEF